MTDQPMRTIHVTVPQTQLTEPTRATTLDAITRYLPDNYRIAKVCENTNDHGDGIVIINGHDTAGWVAEGHVAPRLWSGNWRAEVVR